MSRTKMWWLNDESLAMLERGYLKPNQSVEEKLTLICDYAAKKLNKPELSERFYEIVSKGWASLSSPIWANFGEGRGLPISCVTGDTWINTKNGGKKAKDIKIGDLVLTHKNRFRKVTNVMPTRDRGDIWKIKVNTRMTDLFITGNHQILTNLGWVRVDELDRNKHLVAVNGEVDFGEGVNYTIDMKGFTDYKFVIEEGLICKAVERVNEKGLKKNKSESYVTYYSKPKEFVEVDEDLAWALGLWFAEGSLSTSNKKEPNGIRITLNADEEKNVAERWLSVMSEKFNLKGNIYESEVIRKGKVNKWLSVNFNGKVVGNLFSSFGKGCKIKELPSWVLRLPKNLQAKVLEGFLLGDGSKDKSGGNRVTVSNPKLLLQLYNIGLHLGKDMSLQMQSKASKLSSVSHVYTLVFRGYENSLSKTATNSGVKFKDGLTYCPIVTLERTDKVEDVYDFTVEEDHSFSCAGVVVHNCFTSLVGDDTDHIFKTVHEVAMMTKNGGGTATDFSALRPKGAKVSGGGSSSGVMSFIEVFDSTIKNVSQSGVRRGGFAAYLDINHPEIKEFLRIKDKDSTLQSINNAVVVDDKFMREMIDGDKEKREVWALVLKNRREKGIPYIFFKDTANRNAPEVYKKNSKSINSSNLCISGDSMILTMSGYQRIDSLDNQNVFLWNGSRYSLSKVRKTNTNQKLYKVTVTDGINEYSLKCTADHNFYDIDRVKHNTMSLKGGMQLEPPFYGDVRFVKSVEEIDGLHDTYCANEPTKHKIVINGILTGNCNEIMLSTDENESLVCCLSSMNLYLYDEWKDTDAVQLMIMLLDAVMSDFIEKTTDRSGFERANKFAREQRALGLGVLGWHSYLQHKDIPFDSLQASMLNKMIFKHIKEESVKASQYLAKEYGEPSLMKGTGLRNTTLLAVAPTTSSASILGQSSPSIEPYKSNFYTVDLAKGSFVRKNKSLHKLLIAKGKDTKEVWDNIMFNQGSVQQLSFLNEHEKAVFKTFAEINPEAIIDQAADRQVYICQGQSLNLLIPHVMEIKEVNRLHIRAWEKGLKGLYYQRGTNATQEQLAKMKVCSSCEA